MSETIEGLSINFVMWMEAIESNMLICGEAGFQFS